MSTDLSFKEDRHDNKLYISCGNSRPSMITIEYIPKLNSVEDIKSDYWIDILIKYVCADKSCSWRNYDALHKVMLFGLKTV